MREITVERPIVYPNDTTASGKFGNDMPELFCTVIRALIPAERDRKGIEKEVYDSIHLILQWLRVLGRQYWLLQGPTGYGSYCWVPHPLGLNLAPLLREIRLGPKDGI